MKASEILQKARARIEDPCNWCQEELRIGRRRCALGAIGLPDARQIDSWLFSAARVVIGDRPMGNRFNEVTFVNDVDGHAAVLEMYDIAISMAMSDEAAE